MTEFQLKEYQDYLYAKINRLKAHIDNLDTEYNNITCSLINYILDDIKNIVSCIELREKVQNNPATEKGVVNQ